MSLKNYIFTSINTKPLEAEDFANNFTIRVKKQRNTRKLSQIAEVDRRAAPTTSTSSSSPPPPPPPAQPSAGQDASSNFDRLRRTISSTDDISWFKKIMKLWSYISVEPVMVCWILPTCLLYIAIENLALEKVSACVCVMVACECGSRGWVCTRARVCLHCDAIQASLIHSIAICITFSNKIP